MTDLRNAIVQTLTLFGSTGTLLCCALPAMLVSIGAGAVMASLVTNVPQLVWLSEHKIPLFGFAAIMLVICGAMIYINRRMPCPVDLRQARLCRRARRWSIAVFIISALLYAVGFYFAFIATHLAT
jgi:uncharacterized iron-regulated membrane protein